MKNQNENPPDIQDVDQTRRRLTKAGLAAPAVLGVLASRPVLGQTIQSLHNCTPSGHISGFASPNPNGTICSLLGQSPAYYAPDLATWPSAFKTTTPTRAKDFNPALFGFVAAYMVTDPGTGERDATVWDILKGYAVNPANGNPSGGLLETRSGFDDEDFTLGKEAIAACMNAMATPGYPQGFPISATQVVNMFNNVIDSGTDPVTSTANWNRLEVIEYFQSLHPNL